MIRRLLPLAALTALLLASPMAKADRIHRPPIRRSLISVQLEDPSGRRLETFYHRGQTFVLGRHGERYDVRVHNHSGRRVEVVIGVDGRDAVSGQVVNSAQQRGYVIPPYGSVRVEGFRRSMSAVAAFRFTDPDNSYSSRMGTPHRVGQVTVAAFPERTALLDRPLAEPELDYGPPPRRAPARTTNNAPRGGDKAAAPPRAGARASGEVVIDDGRGCCFPLPRRQNNLGTEYGETRTSRVVETHFEREHPSRPAQYVTIRYDDVEGLESRGIEVRPRPRPTPRPGPITIEQPRYAPPPPPRVLGWR